MKYTRTLYRLYLFLIIITFAVYLILDFALFTSYGSVTIYTPNGGAIGSASDTALLFLIFELIVLIPWSKNEFENIKKCYIVDNNIEIKCTDIKDEESVNCTYIKDEKEYSDENLFWYDKIISLLSKLNYAFQIIIFILALKGVFYSFRH